MPESEEEVVVTTPGADASAGATPSTSENAARASLLALEAGRTRQATEPEKWNSPRKQGFVVTLPSGNLCRVKRTISLVTLLKEGRIPNPLADTISSYMSENKKLIGLNEMPFVEQKQMLDLMNKIICETIIEPKVEIPPEEDESGNTINPDLWEPPAGRISLQDLTAEDRLFVWYLAQGGVADLATFRATQAVTVANLQDGGKVQPAPEQPPRAVRRAAKRAG